MALSTEASSLGETALSQVSPPPELEKASGMTPPEETKSEFKPGMSFYLAFVSICIVTLAAALDATSLSIALPIITEKLHGTAIEAFWSGTSFLVTSAVFQPVIAGLSHTFGRKEVRLLRTFTNGEVQCSYFAVGSCIIVILCRWLDFGCRGHQLHLDVCTCHSMTQRLAKLSRLVGRSIQGIGGGGILALGEILVTDLVPLAVRGGMIIHS
jgi:MFS family permease